MKELFKMEKFKRGQVWWADIQCSSTSSIQSGTRPVLIVSNDKCNSHSTVLTVVPLTTQDKTELPTHLKVKNPKNIITTILCEQITSIDTYCLKDYMGTFEEVVMNEVMDKIKIQLGLKELNVDLKVETVTPKEEIEDKKENNMTELKPYPFKPAKNYTKNEATQFIIDYSRYGAGSKMVKMYKLDNPKQVYNYIRTFTKRGWYNGKIN